MDRKRGRGGRRWSESTLVAALRELVRRRGERVTEGEFCRECGVTEWVIRSRCGGWRRLWRAAGLPERGRTKREVVEALRQVALRRGVELSQDEFARESGISRDVVRRMFGSWVELREEAGLRGERRRPAPRYTRESLQEALMGVVAARGARVTIAEFTRVTGISAATVWRLWGSWAELRRGVGVTKVNRPRRQWSDEALMKEYHRVMVIVDKLPTEAEFDRFARCRMQTLYHRFGGVREVRRRFAEYLLGLKARREGERDGVRV